MPTGIVKWFKKEKNFGFIYAEEFQKDFFVYGSAVKDFGRKPKFLVQNDIVSFEIGIGKKGEEAHSVVVTNPARILPKRKKERNK